MSGRKRLDPATYATVSDTNERRVTGYPLMVPKRRQTRQNTSFKIARLRMGFEPNAQQSGTVQSRYCAAPFLNGTTPVTLQRLVQADDTASIQNIGVHCVTALVARAWFAVSVTWRRRTLTVRTNGMQPALWNNISMGATRTSEV